jgi:predicted DNA binding CopG/RHH family protein
MKYDAHLQTRISKTDANALKKLTHARNESMAHYIRRRILGIDWSDVLSTHPMSDTEIRNALESMPHAISGQDDEESVNIHIRLSEDELRQISILAIVEGQSRSAYVRDYIKAMLEEPEDDDD